MPLAERLWAYQKERFALAPFALLALAVGSSATAFSALLRPFGTVSVAAIAGAAASALLLWMQMRVLDEFKDAQDDARFRPYRAVPRGLVSLGELQDVLLAAAVLEVVIALTIDPRLILLLALVWTWLALTAVEFFAGGWLRARPGAYMASHCPGGFVICLYLAAFDWMPAATSPHPALLWLGLAATLDTVLLEVGRKLRPPEAEETGVVTYSKAWGRRKAAAAWLGALVATSLCGFAAARHVGFAVPFAAMLVPVALAGAWACVAFARTQRAASARSIERLSALATLVLYLALGPAPILLLGRISWGV